MNCPYCNQDMGPNVTGNFCQKCGHKLIRCASCGEILYRKIKFCPNDGTAVPEEVYNELPDGIVKADAVKQTSQKPGNQATGQNKVASSGPAPKRSVNPGPSKNKPASSRPAPKRPANPSSVPIKPANSDPLGPPPKQGGAKKGLVIGLIILLLVALGAGGYLIADKVMSGSSRKSSTESADKDRNKDRKEDMDEEDSDEKDSDEEASDDKDSDKDEDKKSPDSSDKDKTDLKDKEEAVSFDGDNEDKTDSSDKKKENASNDTKEDTSGVAFKPEKTDYSKIKATVSMADSSCYGGLKKAAVSKASASSVVQDNSAGIKNEAAQMVDGNEITSWQEGVDGDGIGEWTQFILKKEYNVRYLTFKMGNWRDQDRYNMNNRPKGILLRMGGQEYKLTFPDGKNEYMVELSDSLPISDLYLEITSVYKGSSWDDTCISEMTIYVE